MFISTTPFGGVDNPFTNNRERLKAFVNLDGIDRVTLLNIRSGNPNFSGPLWGTNGSVWLEFSVSGVTPGPNNAQVLFKFNEDTTSGFGNPGLNAAGIDNVVVLSAVPEPSTYALFGLGVLALAGFKRQQRNRKQ